LPHGSYEFDGVTNAKLLENPGAMRLGSALRNAKLYRDNLIRASLGNIRNHLAFARRKRSERDALRIKGIRHAAFSGWDEAILTRTITSP
jgi:hypothetical protein